MTANWKILAVKSEIPMAMMMVNTLTRAGCDIFVARAGKKEMALAQENKFDLIVLSLHLPDLSGFANVSEQEYCSG